jgi:hypothetical protein
MVRYQNSMIMRNIHRGQQVIAKQALRPEFREALRDGEALREELKVHVGPGVEGPGPDPRGILFNTRHRVWRRGAGLTATVNES